MSRSTRVTSVQAPNTSAWSPRPKANVSGQFEMSLNPWLSSKFTRYALIDHFFRGSTSPVGTYHKPVSPMKVVVAGRVWTSPDCIEDDEVEVVVCEPGVWDAGGADCAPAADATASAS